MKEQVDTQQVIEQYGKYVIDNYTRLPVVFVRGEGSYIWDAEGKRYLDMFPGWAVSGLGHCPGPVVEAIQRQAAELIHMDNTFYTVPQGQLAEMISQRSFGGKCFFCNSGAEAIEAALKLARLYTNEKKYRFITTLNSFHGRTFGAITATGQSKYHQGFSPLVPGFSYVPFNDVGALEEAFDDEVAAIMFEPIQGEGGINVATDEFLLKARELCSENGAVLILDEVQCGIGRTGKWFGYQHTPVEPDVITMAKSLGGGIAIGGICAREEVAAAMKRGTHASTFGGNPLATAAAVATLEIIEKEGLLAKAVEMGQYITERLESIGEEMECIREIRGRGLMIGIELDSPGAELVDACLAKGLRINCTHDTVLRFMPALTATKEQVDEALNILLGAMRERVQASGAAANPGSEAGEN